MDLAVKKLGRDLDIEATTGASQSNTIDVMYKSHDPHTAYCVLLSLNKNFLELHMAVHRPSGQLDFFAQQTADYRKSLEADQELLSKFPQHYGAVSAQMERDFALQRANDFKAQLQDTKAKIAKTQERMQFLQSRNAAQPARIVTQTKVADNPELQQKLRSELLTLELKRIDLLTKFQPNYRPVQDIEIQISSTKEAITQAQKAAVQEQTTELDPTHEWMRTELAKSETELKDLAGQAAAIANIARQYQTAAVRLNTAGLIQDNLVREAKANEASYLLYRRKREEARISDAFDKSRIANISVAEQPVLPTIPYHNPLLYGMVGFLVSSLLSVGMIIAVDFADPSFRTPGEIEDLLSISVLAAVPYSPNVNSWKEGNGNGNINGDGRHHNANGNGSRGNGAYQSSSGSTTSIVDSD